MIESSAALPAASIAASVSTATVDLYIVETTDLHSNIMDFGYCKDTATEKSGLIHTASLINNACNEVENNALADNDDLIQGSPLADYVSAKGLKADDIHPVYRASNALDYTVGILGNREFSYDLDYLKSALAGTEFSYVNTNVIDTRIGQPMLASYLIKDIEMVDKGERKQILKIGYTGVTPPQIMGQNRANLSGKVAVNDITETVRKYIPEMHEKGADVTVVLARSGLPADPYEVMAENSAYYLGEIPGVNTIMFGRTCAVLPGKDFANIEGANTTKGMLNGVPAVVPGMRGNHLGMVDLRLSNDSGKWQMTQTKVEARPIHNVMNRRPLAAEDNKLVETLKAGYDATHQFVSRPISKSTDDMHSYLAFVQGGSTVQVVNSTQKTYVEYYIQGDPDLAKLPVLSVTASFEVSDCKNSPANCVEVEKDQLIFRNAADLYLYPNTLIVIKANGKEVEE